MREVEESIDHLRRVADEMWLSEGVYEVFGLRRKSALTKPELVASAVHPDDVEAVTAGLAAAVAGDRYDIVHRVVRPDGEVRHVHSKVQRIEGDGGHPDIVLGTIVDVTPVDEAKR